MFYENLVHITHGLTLLFFIVMSVYLYWYEKKPGCLRSNNPIFNSIQFPSDFL